MKSHLIRAVKAALPGLLATAAVFLAAGCVSTPLQDSPHELPRHTLLALSPDGRRALVAWQGAGAVMQARLVTLPAVAGKGAVAPETVALPPESFTMAWSRSADAVLLTTASTSGNRLLRLDLASGTQTRLYEGGGMLRFPLEIDDGAYVFLEAVQPGERRSQWQRLAPDGQKTLLNTKSYGLAAPLEQVGGSLHLLEPTKEFRLFAGPLPQGLRELVTPSTWSIRCADQAPLSCVRDHFFMPRDGHPFSTMEVVVDGRVCQVPGRWDDVRDLQMSRDGSAAVFLGRPTRDGMRAVYAIDTAQGCQAVPAFERGSLERAG